MLMVLMPLEKQFTTATADKMSISCAEIPKLDVVGTKKKCLDEMILLNTYNIGID